jgi:hypothetical protein
MRALKNAIAVFAIGLFAITASVPELAAQKSDKTDKGKGPPPSRPAPTPAPPSRPQPTFQRPTAVPSYRPTAPTAPAAPRPRPPQSMRPTPVPSVRPNVITPRPNPNVQPGGMFNPGAVRPQPTRPSIPPNVITPTPRPGTIPPRPTPPTVTVPGPNPPAAIPTPRPGQPTTTFRPPNVPSGTTNPWLNVPLDRNWPQRGNFPDNRWENWRDQGNWNDFTRNRANIVRNQFYNNYNVNRYGPFFTPDWYRNNWQHGYFWNYRAPTPWYWWNFATLANLTPWLGWNVATPLYYNYGDNFLYSNGLVYYNQQPLGPVETYIDQATQLALSGQQALSGATELQWLPLGVFTLTHGEQSEPTMFVQLAVTKSGLIGGTYRNIATNEVQTVSGRVDPNTQRAAWIIGDNSRFVMEAGIYNLTQDQAPVLMHWGTEQTQTWLLTRVPAPAQQ